jgi:hypothetical protein
MTADSHTGSDWNQFLPHLDGGMYEAFATGYTGSNLSVAKWEGDLEQAEYALAQGKGILAAAQGSKGDTTRQAFALGSYLLVTNMGPAYFRYAQAARYKEWWTYPNYDLQLGQPSGARFKLADGRWRRNFNCGYVIVNPAAATANIVKSGC